MIIKRAKFDYTLLMAVLLLLVISLTFIYTASSTKAEDTFGDSTFFLKKQLFRILIGAVGMYFAMWVDYHKILRHSRLFFWGSLTLLIVLLFAPAEWTVRGTRRWMIVAGFQFQPSELAKYAIVALLARVLAMQELDIKRFNDGVLPQIILAGAVCGAVLLEPDASTALMIFFIVSVLLFVAGARMLHLVAIFGGGMAAVAAALLTIPYQRERLFDFITSLKDSSQMGWQVKQSLLSLGNGGFFGVGLGQSRQQMHWLPDPFTDFIFSIIGEELGLLGTLGVVALFLVVIYSGFRIAVTAPDREGMLLATGITITIAGYALMNMAVVTHLVPTTGIPMPFISYGGSSLIMNLFAVGVLLNISYQGGARSLKATRELKHGRRIRKSFSLGF